MKKWRYVVVQNWSENILKIRDKNYYFIPDISEGIPDYDSAYVEKESEDTDGEKNLD